MRRPDLAIRIAWQASEFSILTGELVGFDGEYVYAVCERTMSIHALPMRYKLLIMASVESAVERGMYNEADKRRQAQVRHEAN